MRFKKDYFLIAVIFTVILGGCKKWEDHVAVDNPDLTQDLYRAVANNPSLSKFAEFVSRAGLDTLLKSSKTYTVWAPSNDALATLDPSIVTDVNRLRTFLLNHISNQLYFTRDATPSKRVGMLSGKYNNFFVNKFEDANITSADKFVKNGVLHVIDKNILVIPNLWDYINSTAAQYSQNSFIAGLNFTSFDPSQAVIDSISSSTGLPIYHAGTGIVNRNSFNDRIVDTRREDKQYTFFVIANAGFTLKADSLKPYYSSTTTAKTDSLDRWNIVKDLVVDTLYPTAASLPAVLISRSGVPVPLNSSLVIDSKKVSNGMVYVLSSSLTTTASKFQQIIIQGESPTGFQSDKTSSTSYRVRPNLLTNINYTDILVSGHGVTGYYSFYRLNEMPSMKYNVYAFSVNDFQAAAVFQSIGAFSFTAPATYTALTTVPALLSYGVPLKTATGAYNEILVGTFTSTAFGTLDLRLTSGSTTINTAGTGPIVLDYLRIVPIP